MPTPNCYLQPNLKVKLDFDASVLVNVLSGVQEAIVHSLDTLKFALNEEGTCLYCLRTEEEDRAEKRARRAGPTILCALLC